MKNLITFLFLDEDPANERNDSGYIQVRKNLWTMLPVCVSRICTLKVLFNFHWICCFAKQVPRAHMSWMENRPDRVIQGKVNGVLALRYLHYFISFALIYFWFSLSFWALNFIYSVCRLELLDKSDWFVSNWYLQNTHYIFTWNHFWNSCCCRYNKPLSECEIFGRTIVHKQKQDPLELHFH